MAEIKVSQEWLSQERKIKSIRTDIATARGIISDGLVRYKKKMLHAKNKKQVEDLSMFAELDGYESKQQIQDAFGWDYISDTQMVRLNDLWDAREQVIANRGRFADRVTQMLERAMDNCGDKFADALEEFDALVRLDNENSARIERENSINNYNRYHAGLK